ncbi:phosphotransferase [Jatrophihabitans sp. DSM 45814]
MTVARPIIRGEEHAGRAAASHEKLAEIGRMALGRQDLQLASANYLPVEYTISTIATERLTRARITMTSPTGDECTARVFIKTLHDASHWPMIRVIPDAIRPGFIERFPWRLEIAAYTGALDRQIPDGLRLPVIYAIDELEPGFAAIWMEDVEQYVHLDWDTDRYQRAARSLGRLAALRQYGRVAPLLGAAARSDFPNGTLRVMIDGRLRLFALPILLGEDLWSQPAVRSAQNMSGDHQLVSDLRALVPRIDELLGRTDGLPMTYAHGDASPQNLLVPADDPETFVTIDWGFDSPLPVGHDLGQLLVGRCHSGELPPERILELAPVVEAAYLAGLADSGMQTSDRQVCEGFRLGLLLRSGFTSVLLDDVNEAPTDALVLRWDHRLRLTRAILDLVAPVL